MGLEEIPEDWKRSIIIPIFKKKDRLHCGNYRGVSLLSHPSKVFTQILLQRMRKRSDEMFSEEQAGFRASRSTIDQIFTLGQMFVLYSEMSRNLCIGYIDFRKAFDSIWREGLWRVLMSMAYADKIVRLLKNMYRVTFQGSQNWRRAI